MYSTNRYSENENNSNGYLNQSLKIIKLIEEGQYSQAIRMAKERSPLSNVNGVKLKMINSVYSMILNSIYNRIGDATKAEDIDLMKGRLEEIMDSIPIDSNR